MKGPLRIEGTVAPGFEAVRQAFEANFTDQHEIGAAVCVYHKGERVVDLWGGLADVATQRPWTADTLMVMFSATKGLAALCMLMLADRGLLDYDAPVTRYWPGFGQAGKADITVRTLMNHRAGVCAIDTPLTLEDFERHPDRVRDALEQQAPLWPPDSTQGYHGVSYGPYVAELFRHIESRSIGRFLAEEVAGPLGLDLFLGLPESEEPRVATLYPADNKEKLFQVVPKLLTGEGLEGRVFRAAIKRNSPTQRAFKNPRELGARGLQNYNTRRVRALELPWCNALGTARGLAELYSILALGGSKGDVQLVRPELLQALHPRQSWVETDEVLRKPLGYSQGFIKEETRLFSPNTEMFGHPGAGGALGMADPKAEISVGYLMNRMGHHIRSPRALALCDAVYGSLGLRPRG